MILEEKFLSIEAVKNKRLTRKYVISKLISLRLSYLSFMIGSKLHVEIPLSPLSSREEKEIDMYDIFVTYPLNSSSFHCT